MTRSPRPVPFVLQLALFVGEVLDDMIRRHHATS